MPNFIFCFLPTLSPTPRVCHPSSLPQSVPLPLYAFLEYWLMQLHLHYSVHLWSLSLPSSSWVVLHDNPISTNLSLLNTRPFHLSTFIFPLILECPLCCCRKYLFFSLLFFWDWRYLVLTEMFSVEFAFPSLLVFEIDQLLLPTRLHSKMHIASKAF